MILGGYKRPIKITFQVLLQITLPLKRPVEPMIFPGPRVSPKAEPYFSLSALCNTSLINILVMCSTRLGYVFHTLDLFFVTEWKMTILFLVLKLGEHIDKNLMTA